MSDQGIKVSLPGNDVVQAPDSALLFSSSWPNPKIAANIFIPTASATFVNNLATVYNHRLGFVPLIIPYGNSSGGSQAAAGVQQTANISRQNISVDNQNIYFINTGGSTGYPDISFLILYIDIEKPYTAPTIDAGTSTSASRSADWGIKASKLGKDVSSTDLRNFTIHSASRSPMLHAVVPGTTAANGSVFTFSYTHTLTYPPIFSAYTKDPSSNGTYVMINGYAGLSTNGNTITITGTTAQQCSIVLFKDPFIVNDNIVTVNL